MINNICMEDLTIVKKELPSQEISVDNELDARTLKIELDGIKEEYNLLHTSATEPLLCKVCNLLPRSLPLYSCMKHHKVCNECMAQRDDCPLCSKPLCKETSPLLHALLTSLSRPCQWSNYGCSFKSRQVVELETHEAECKHQGVLCWGCGRFRSMKLFDQHNSEYSCFYGHSVFSSPAKIEILLQIPKPSGHFPPAFTGEGVCLPVAIKHCGKMFYLRIKRLPSRGAWVSYVAAQLSPSKCSRFYSSITLLSSDSENPAAWSYKGNPSSLAVPLESVVKAGDCLVMSDSAMEQLMCLNIGKDGSVISAQVEIKM